MDFGYAIQILREKAVDNSYELTLAVEQKDEEIQERQKERLAILQDAMNALAKPSSVSKANELSPLVSGSLWPDDLLSPTNILKARLNILEIKQLSGDKLNTIDEFKKAIKLIESVKQ
jgi:hypothetical protein